MKRVYNVQSGKRYAVTDTYPRIDAEEGKRRQAEAMRCIVKMLRDRQSAHTQIS